VQQQQQHTTQQHSDQNAPTQDEHERRQDQLDGNWYTHAEFVKEYGDGMGNKAWQSSAAQVRVMQTQDSQLQPGQAYCVHHAPSVSNDCSFHRPQFEGAAPPLARADQPEIEHRVDLADGNWYTRAEFLKQYGDSGAWEAAHHLSKQPQPVHSTLPHTQDAQWLAQEATSHAQLLTTQFLEKLKIQAPQQRDAKWWAQKVTNDAQLLTARYVDKCKRQAVQHVGS